LTNKTLKNVKTFFTSVTKKLLALTNAYITSNCS